MKRIFTLLFVLSVCAGAYAQDNGYYEATFTIQIRDGANNHDGGCTNRFDMWTTLSGEGETNFWPQDLNPIGTSYKTVTKRMTIPIDKMLTRVHFRGERNWHNLFSCKGDDGWGADITPGYTGCWTSPTYTDRIPMWDSRITIKIVPKVVNLFYFNRSGQQETSSARFYLPQSHRITIKATQGYPSNVYGWQYQIGSGAWTNFSTSLYSGNTLTFSGDDISNDFLNSVVLNNQNVKVRFSYGCGGVSNVMTLNPLLSAPDYTVAEGIAPTCSYLTDGKIRVTFNRTLYTDETVSFTIDGVPYRIQNLTKADFSADNTYVMDGFPSFNNRVVSFVGVYKGKNTFTDDPNTQNRPITIPVRTPVTFMADSFAVHCFNGSDGKVTVTAQGGNQQYTAFLDQNGNNLKQIVFAEGATASFTDLPTGQYVVRLLDSKLCESRNASGAPITYNPYVSEPDQRVLVSAIENIEPLGFGLKNGYITIRAESGTNPYTFEWTDINSGDVLTAEPSEVEGESMKSRLSGIGKGRYRVIARDAQYALASPQTEQNISGCYDTLSFIMDEPPLLTVYLDEYHFVSCNGYTDGEVVAHGDGGRPYLPGHQYEPYMYEWFTVDNNMLTPFGESDSIATERPSAWYRIKITDRNGIVAWSPDYHLDQPDVLKINFATSQLLCNGDTNGTAEAKPQGGTLPYRYTWSTEESTPRIGNLTDGWYSVVVTDVRGCTTYDQTEVVVPEGLAVEATVVPPLCNGYSNGSIALTVTGGLPAYTYAWSTGANGTAISSLPQGNYTVRVTDANGCFLTKDYTLTDPALFPVDLGPDRVLCKDQTLLLNPVIDDAGAQYQWAKNGDPFAATSQITLSDAGVYTLLVTDSKGCKNQGDVKISRDDSEISANIVVATRVPLSGTFRVANISHPAPDSIRWLLPAEAAVFSKTPDYVELAFAAKGEYTIGLKSFSGACEAVTYEPVRVVNPSELTDYQTPVEPYIKQFIVTPNPNTGRFTATVELREAGDFQLSLYNGQGMMISQQHVVRQVVSSVNFEVASGASRGIYVLQLLTAQGYSTFKVVIE